VTGGCETLKLTGGSRRQLLLLFLLSSSLTRLISITRAFVWFRLRSLFDASHNALSRMFTDVDNSE